MKLCFEPNDFDTQIALNSNSAGDIEFYDVSIKNPMLKDISKVTLVCDVPMGKAFSTWNPMAYFRRALQENWNWPKFPTRICIGAPVQSVIGINGENIMTVAASDAKTPMNFMSGFDEKTGNIKFAIELFTFPVQKFEEYKTTIRVDKRNIPFYKAIQDVSAWWDNEYSRSDVPEAAREMVYSIWYNFHQNIDVDKVVKECEEAYALGMRTVIVDDGWQTENNAGGYAYCGDWKVASNKIADMKSFVDRIHDIGMKFILWYSVPYVGKYTEAYEKFRGKFLYFNNMGYGALDPRYPEVREYLIDLYESAVRDWGLDGLKLDFIDAFRLEDTEKFDETWDIPVLENAIEQLLKDIKNRLSAINKDLCLEFRQSYFGPAVTQCGNMLRVGDCAGDSLKNRVGSIDLRLISGKTAVHSDMLMWDMKNTPENAALQLINVLFAVPQISVFIGELPKKHKKMLKFYLDFWNENRHILLDGIFKAENPEANYSSASAETDSEIVIVSYSENLLELKKEYDRIVCVNGTGKDVLVIRSDVDLTSKVFTIKDCMGNIIETGVIKNNGHLVEFNIPQSGTIEIK